MSDSELLAVIFDDAKNPKHKWITPTEEQYRDGLLIRKLFGDGREACIYQQLFNFKLCLYRTGPKSIEGIIDEFWEYEKLEPALFGLAEWTGEGEPEGWIRHCPSGRRRPDGDKTKEYIHF